MFQAHVVGQERSGSDMLSLYGAESPDGRRAEVGTVSDFFRLLGRIRVSGWLYFIVEVRVHLSSPCGRSGDVRGRRSITF